MSVGHYENFPVASLLCPAPLRPAVEAIYHYARTADDLADEGQAPPAERLAALASYRADLHAIAAGRAPSARWPAVFVALRQSMQRHALPLAPLEDLLSAFEQDVVQTRWPDRAALLDYCARSAQPIGRLLLHLYDVHESHALHQADAICTGLQLANFWQDLSRDIPRGRLYVSSADQRAHGLSEGDWLALNDTPATQAAVLELSDWAARLLREGAPLARRLPGRIGWELRLVVQGGLRVLARIHALDGAVLRQRPTLRGRDVAPMLLGAWRM